MERQKRSDGVNRKADPVFGILPDGIYTDHEIVSWMSNGRVNVNLARDMEKAGFVWHSPIFKPSYRFAMGHEVIKFITENTAPE